MHNAPQVSYLLQFDSGQPASCLIELAMVAPPEDAPPPDWARLEYQHDFTADSRTFMQYADLLGPTYATSVSGYDRSRFMLGLGVLFDFGAYSLQVDYRGVVGSSDQRDNALQVMFQAGR